MIQPITTKELPYPGAPILLTSLRRRDEAGDVRVQQYAENQFRVACFLPGVIVQARGDSTKIEPEVSQWVTTGEEAEEVFHRYVEQAHAARWEDIQDAD